MSKAKLSLMLSLPSWNRIENGKLKSLKIIEIVGKKQIFVLKTNGINYDQKSAQQFDHSL